MNGEPHVLMCPPDYYGIEYEINPWMSRRRPCDRKLAMRQWLALRRLLERLGAKVSCVAPAPGLPDMVFTANAAVVCRDTAVLSRFRYAQRRGEEPRHRQWFADHGFCVRELESRGSFEGAGDALFCGETLFAGYRTRSDVGALYEVGELLGCRVIPLELVCPRYYHLDTCFCPLAADVAIYYPAAFDEYGRRALRASIETLIEVGDEAASRLACNAVVLGQSVVTPEGCVELHARLRPLGFSPCETPLGEFIKAGGSAKCLTLRLDGEEAAAWRTRETAALGTPAAPVENRNWGSQPCESA